MNCMEEWRQIEKYPKYEISSLGRVRNIATGSIRSEIRLISGYCIVDLYNPKRMNLYIHRLVAKAFIPNPYNWDEVNHIDHCRYNNKVSNLEWILHADNMKHSKGRSILRDWVHATGTIELQISATELARKYSIYQGPLNRVALGKRESYKGWSRYL